MSVRWTLLRHGMTEGAQGFRGRLDVPLSEEGLMQMKDAAAALDGYDCVVTSPLQRCARFAGEWARQNGLPLEIEADLRELDFGQWEGRTAAELMVDQAADLGRFWDDPYGFTPPDGEPVAHFDRRIIKAMTRLTHRFAGQRVLLVTHGGVIRLLLARARRLPRKDLLQVEAGYATCHPLATILANGQLRLSEAT
ncbi:histidine phosphatase family protein [Pseudomonas matsuisoli]|uniref:Alpha-ribazole phosphatase n=1 Tax=Pseudomonas matsuisoli TaxID=1515666 RepID=A0A917UWH2_9PSED|nr:histidine phosphatase family protein [Pseudomonas matsuisoli]GGJ90338.1 hypothetical protein GCM10009304_15010 [Pseudomonas matsuisoli]